MAQFEGSIAPAIDAYRRAIEGGVDRDLAFDVALAKLRASYPGHDEWTELFDLTLDGCLVEMSFGTLSGTNIRLQIDLPGEGWTLLHCETLHIAGHNAFAVKFTRLDDEIRTRIGREGDCPAE